MNDQPTTPSAAGPYESLLPNLADGYGWILQISEGSAVLELIQPYSVNESERPLRYRVINWDAFEVPTDEERFHAALRVHGTRIAAGYMRPAFIESNPVLKDPTATVASTIDLEAIRRREATATPGPWHWNGEISSGQISLEAPTVREVIQGRDYPTSVISATGMHTEGYIDITAENAEFIAQARTDVPLLIAEIERLDDLLGQAKTV